MSERLIFTTSDLEITLEPECLEADLSSQLLLSVNNINILGFEVPFSQAYVGFNIEQGVNLIDLINTKEQNSVIVRSKGKPGEAIIGIYSLQSGSMIEKISIQIQQSGYTIRN